MNEHIQELKVLCDEATIKLREIRERMSEIEQLTQKHEPELIQGYTAEQWQEIIDGGYLCDVSDFSDFEEHSSAYIEKLGENDTFFSPQCNYFYKFCRPAQIKGVMRPIFVEPVDKKSRCVFFKGGDPIGNGYFFWNDYTERNMYIKHATKYIEL